MDLSQADRIEILPTVYHGKQDCFLVGMVGFQRSYIFSASSTADRDYWASLVRGQAGPTPHPPSPGALVASFTSDTAIDGAGIQKVVRKFTTGAPPPQQPTTPEKPATSKIAKSKEARAARQMSLQELALLQEELGQKAANESVERTEVVSQKPDQRLTRNDARNDARNDVKLQVTAEIYHDTRKTVGSLKPHIICKIELERGGTLHKVMRSYRHFSKFHQKVFQIYNKLIESDFDNFSNNSQRMSPTSAKGDTT